MTQPTLKLQRNAEELLQEFPATEPDFDAQAAAIVARIQAATDKTGAELLKAPDLAAEPGEPALPSSVRATTTPLPKGNFAEMARRSVQKKDDATELAKELLAATAQPRRPDPEMVERVRAAGRAAATSTPLPTTASSAEEPQRPSGVVSRAATTERAAAASTNNRGTLVGIAGGLLALAAGVALFIRASGEDERTQAALAAQKAAEAPAHAAAPAVAAAAPASKSNEGVVSPDALAAAPLAVGQEPTKGSAPKAAAGAIGAAAALASKPAASAGSAGQELAVRLEDDPTPAPAPMRERKPEPAPEPQLKPAEGTAGSVPLSPSSGAVGTALGAVRGGAQACLAGQTDPVTAVVTFGSDGHVLRVSASGPSGACIQAALSKAHITPFAKESFSATTTIRPP